MLVAGRKLAHQSGAVTIGVNEEGTLPINESIDHQWASETFRYWRESGGCFMYQWDNQNYSSRCTLWGWPNEGEYDLYCCSFLNLTIELSLVYFPRSTLYDFYSFSNVDVLNGSQEVFQLIVSSFEKLDDKSSLSYIKRTSILETVAKVRSCVVMLDLECDALIAEMFQHFFKSIR